MTKRIKRYVNPGWPEFSERFLAFIARRKALREPVIEDIEIPPEVQAEIDAETIL